MGRNLFIADLHIGSQRIIDLCHRPFRDIDDQDEAITRNWRQAVNAEDAVYILGDLSEGDPQRVVCRLKHLPGRKVLVLGNHDDEASVRVYQKSKTFDRICWYTKIMDAERKVILFHYPIMDWEDRQFGSALVYGHIHNKDMQEMRDYYKDKPCYNCGADVIGFTPKTLKELEKIKGEQK